MQSNYTDSLKLRVLNCQEMRLLNNFGSQELGAKT